MQFKVDVRQIKTRELLAVEGNLAGMIELMSRFAVDDNSDPIPQDEAREQLLDMDFESNYALQMDFLASVTQRQKIARR